MQNGGSCGKNWDNEDKEEDDTGRKKGDAAAKHPEWLGAGI